MVNLDPELEYEIQAAAHSVGGGWGTWSEPLLASTHEQSTAFFFNEAPHN